MSSRSEFFCDLCEKDISLESKGRGGFGIERVPGQPIRLVNVYDGDDDLHVCRQCVRAIMAQGKAIIEDGQELPTARPF